MRVIAAKDATLDPLRDVPVFRELLNPRSPGTAAATRV